MNSRMLELATDQRTAELRATANRAGRSRPARRAPVIAAPGPQHPIRRRTGWALVTVGLWLASADH